MKTRLFLLALVFGLLLNEPLISIVNRPVLVAGMPVLYVYIFGVWAVMIGAIGYELNRHPPADEPAADE
jgi:hypothetical protein